jgi:hypothetical protein
MSSHLDCREPAFDRIQSLSNLKVLNSSHTTQSALGAMYLVDAFYCIHILVCIRKRAAYLAGAPFCLAGAKFLPMFISFGWNTSFRFVGNPLLCASSH